MASDCRLHYRQTGVDNRGELPAEDGNVAQAWFGAEIEPFGQFDVGVEARFGCFDLGDDVVFFAERLSHIPL